MNPKLYLKLYFFKLFICLIVTLATITETQITEVDEPPSLVTEETVPASTPSAKEAEVPPSSEPAPEPVKDIPAPTPIEVAPVPEPAKEVAPTPVAEPAKEVAPTPVAEP